MVTLGLAGRNGCGLRGNDGSTDPVGKGGRATAGRAAHGAPDGSTDPVGKGGRATAGRAARSETEGQPELSGGCARHGGGSARVKRRPRPPWRRVSPS